MPSIALPWVDSRRFGWCLGLAALTLFYRGEGIEPLDEIVAFLFGAFERKRAGGTLYSERVDQEIVEGVGRGEGCAEGLVLCVDELNDVCGAPLVEVGDQFQVARRGLGGVLGEGDVGVRKARLVERGADVLFEPLRDDRAIGF